MTEKDKLMDVLIIGAGIAGIMAANQLQQQGFRVALLEKSRGVGGRMATRRMAGGRADTGAQFFTVRSPILLQIAAEWQRQGLIFEWGRGWDDGSFSTDTSDGYPRYAVNGGMTGLAKFYRQRLTILTEQRVTQLQLQENGWLLTTEHGDSFPSRAVINTAPAPQALAICSAGNVPLQSVDLHALQRIRYAPCLCALFAVSGEVRLPPPGARQQPERPFSWIADNKAKGISANVRIITMHMHPEQSAALYGEADELLLARFAAELQPLLGPDSTISDSQLKRWRYALPLVTHPQRTLLAAGVPPLLFAGDAFNGPRVEGAILSGLEAAAQLHTILAA